MWHPDQTYAAEQARRAQLEIGSVERPGGRGRRGSGAFRAAVRRLIGWAIARARAAEARP